VPPLPLLSVMKSTKLPPMVHPQTLAAAAAHCVEFGGNSEALNAAALAGALIQAQLLQVHRKMATRPPEQPSCGGEAQVPVQMLHTPLLMEQATSASQPPSFADAVMLNEQAKQAMAAARATNTELRDSQAGKLRPGDDAQDAAMPGVALTSSGALPVSAIAQTLGLPPAMIQHPMMLMRPSVPSQMPAQSAKMSKAPGVVPLLSTVRDSGQPTVTKEERKKEEKKGKLTEGEEEPLRCHLHRKPQLNCRTCRRVYYSALGPNDHKKEVRRTGERFHELDDFEGPRRKTLEAFEIANKQTFNFNSMLRDQILKSTYFKSLMNIETFEGIVDELYQYAESAEVYGANTTTVPSTLFCCLFRFFTLGITYEELLQLVENQDSAYIRCCGFLYMRFGCCPEKLWDHLGEYCLDDQEFEPSKSSPQFTITVGEYVEALLMDEKYYYTALPRIPVAVKKKIEEKVAPLVQYRRRSIANSKILHAFREPNTLIEACSNGTWLEGHTISLDERIASRIVVRVKLEDGSEETLHVGKVILREDRRRRRSRSRSRSPRRTHSPDWSRSKGKSDQEMVQELRARQRERAVCTSGKEYARKPIGFMSGLALKRDVGLASARLREEETYAPRQVERRKMITEEEEIEKRIELRRTTEEDREKNQRMQQLYEKYGTAKPPEGHKKDVDADLEEAPDVLRLG